MSRRQRVHELGRQAPCVLPSLLLCDFGDLRSEVNRLTAAGFLGFHLDVMDGNFVPNLTYGMPIVAGLRGLTSLPLDVHLMIRNPGNYVEAFYEAGADSITIHREAVADPLPVLKQIRALGAAAGIALDPETPVDELTDCVGHVDLVLIMSVKAGFGGQSFRPEVLPKLAEARAIFGNDVLLEVDGGVNTNTIAACTDAGAELLVAGSAIFDQGDYQAALRNLKEHSQPA
jgi:ribulose-phosphate 3-epimerase